jgi:hypothetical protein
VGSDKKCQFDVLYGNVAPKSQTTFTYVGNLGKNLVEKILQNTLKIYLHVKLPLYSHQHLAIAEVNVEANEKYFGLHCKKNAA